MNYIRRLLWIPAIYLSTTNQGCTCSTINQHNVYVPFLHSMLRLTGVVGHIDKTGERKNNLLFVSGAGKLTEETTRQHVVFFPGDVQAYKSQMASHFLNKKWIDWCYENTAALLASQFPQAWIWIVEPSKMHEGTFSCYDNFLQGNLLGAPESFDNHDALQHLQQLLKTGVDLVNSHFNGTKQDQVCKIDTKQGVECNVAEVELAGTNSCKKSHIVTLDLPLILIGFSKGCVVLNQFLHELKDAQTNSELKQFVQNISEWYWLDGGHSKESDTWITKKAVLLELAKLKTPINVHVTPYQVHDANRPHIEEEERVFVDTLKAIQADVKETLHFENEKRSLENHFKVLEQIVDMK